MKIAVIGAGISGNIVAYHLSREHDVTVFEASDRVGGHANTVAVEHNGQHFSVETGFATFNEHANPGFTSLLGELGVSFQRRNMEFSVQHEETGLEFSSTTLNTLFAQRRNLLRPAFRRMFREILRFNREAPAMLEPAALQLSMQAYLIRENYSHEFIEHFILPMGAAIWSARLAIIRNMPASFFIRYFHDRGMLGFNKHQAWRVIKGGTRNYVDKLVAGHRDRIMLNAPVESVSRSPHHVEVKIPGEQAEKFDYVFIACHSNQALKILAEPCKSEVETLGAFQYEANEAVLHTDESLMPKRRKVWAALNYYIPDDSHRSVALSYDMNILQGIEAPVQFILTLNHTHSIDPLKIIRRFRFSHPVLTPRAVVAQEQHAHINGANRTYFCGAYWKNGLHEDGVASALSALGHFEEQLGSGKDRFHNLG